MIRRAVPLVVVLALAGCDDAPSTAAPPAPSASRHAARLSAAGVRFRAQHAALAAVSTDQSCPKLDELGTGSIKVAAIDHAYLSHLAGDGPSPYNADDARWQLLTLGAVRAVTPPSEVKSEKQGVDTLFKLNELGASHPLVGVIRVTERKLPVLADGQYTRGEVKGWLGVFRTADATLLCATGFEAFSSEEVSAEADRKPDVALWQNLQRKLREELSAAAHRLDRRFDLELG